MDFLYLCTRAVQEHRKVTNRLRLAGLVAFVIPVLVIAEPLSETGSLQLGLEHPDFIRLLESQVEGARGELIKSQSWANPELELSREEAGDETETGVWLHQPIDFSGRRRLDQDTSEMKIRVAEAGNELQRVERIADIRRSFYQALFHQQKQQLFAQWVDRFSSVEADMRKREAAGDVSGYDRLRISREQASVLARRRGSQAEFEAAWQQLLGKIGQENSHNFNRIDGHLLPGELPALSKVLGGADQYPVLVQRSQQAEAARLNARSVARSHIPELTFGVGHKAIDRPGADESGLMLSASVALPLFDRKQGEQQQARAKAIQAESEYQLASQQLRAEIRSLWTKADQTSTNARLFSEQNVAPSFELVRIAEASYDANEIGVLELIDAYRSALDAEISALTLAIDARLVRIDLDAMTDGIRP